MKIILFLLLIPFFYFQVFATAQQSDRIIYNGKKYALFNNPLEEYFDKYPDKRPKNDILSTSNWRDYIATFEIRNNSLLLKDIEIEVSDTSSGNENDLKYQSILNEVFPDTTQIKIDWLTGMLVLPYGKIVNYVHLGYGSTFNNYILLEIDKGNLKKEIKLNHKEYKKYRQKQFEVFKKTDEYKNLKEDSKKDGKTDKEIDTFLKDFLIDYLSIILIE